MDRRVKERLVGATILVVLIVLIVPELLSGPKRAVPLRSTGLAEPVRNVTVDLATSKATSAEAPGTASSPATAPVDEDGAASDSPAAAPLGEPDAISGHHAAAAPTVTPLQAQQPAPAVVENETLPPHANPEMPKGGAPRQAPAEAVHHNWAVQLGSFASRANAEKLQRRLRTQSFSAFVSSSGVGRALRYRVRVGPLADRASAERTIVRLRKEGLTANAIPL